MANLRVDKITSTETFEKTGSVQFDGVNDGLTISDNADFDLGTGDFTIEGWYYLANAGAYQSLMDWRGSGGDGNYPALFRNNTGNFIYYYVNSVVRINNVEISYDTWFHVSICRFSGITRLFIDGKEKGSFVDNTNYISRDILLGLSQSNSNDLKGHISNYRVIKGKALYGGNFKPPMRELENIPGTVLLACQSKTDASLEKTGKTITANGNAVASELTPGILTPVVKSGGGSAITGSVEFDGTGDYLSLAANSDFNFGSDNFTIEGFFYKGGATTLQTLLCSDKYYIAGNDGNWILRITSGTQIAFASYNGTGSEEYTEFSAKSDDGGWHHFAFVREGTGSNQSKFYFDGVHRGSMTVSKSLTDAGTNGLRIGEESDSGPGNNFMNGFLSNIRIVNGTALYTADFIPPTRELKRVPGTVLLCCQDSDNPLTEATGKTITGYGSLQRTDGPELVTNGYFNNGTTGWSVTGGAIAVTSGQLQLTNSNTTLGKVDQTITTVVGQTYQVSALVTPDGGGHFPRLYVGADNDYTPVVSSANIQQLVTVIYTAVSTSTVISLNSNTNNANAVTLLDDVSAYDISYDADAPASNFTPQVGDDRQITFEGVTKINTDAYFYLPTGNTESRDKGAGTRGISMGGSDASAAINTIQYINISTTGNAINFGDLPAVKNQQASAASSTRGISAGGYSPNESATVSYITIASTGDAKDFGDLTLARRLLVGCSSQTRGIFAGGYDAPNKYNTMDYITIASTGDALDFGDMVADGQTASGRYGSAGYASPTRGVWHGGYGAPAYRNIIDYATIASKGNTKDFGDSSISNYYMGGCSNSIRGISGGAWNPSPAHLNLIEYTTIATTGNAQDFGDLIQPSVSVGACASQIRGVFVGGYIGSSKVNNISYVTLMSMGNAIDFGDLTTPVAYNTGCSNGHGGLG